MAVPIAFHKPDARKALEILLYVAAKVPNVYHALKVIYFADKLHLGRCGRLMYGEAYWAMRLGPVPSMAYDMVKAARDESAWLLPEVAGMAREGIEVDEKHQIVPKRSPDLELLSPSEIECLDEAIETYGSMSFSDLRAIAHEDEAYLSADSDDHISVETLASSLPNARELLEYLRSE